MFNAMQRTVSLFSAVGYQKGRDCVRPTSEIKKKWGLNRYEGKVLFTLRPIIR